MTGSAAHRGEVWLAELGGSEKTRPVVLVSREEAYARREIVTVALVTSRVRHVPSHVLAEDVGVPGLHGAVNCDALRTIRKSMLVERLGGLSSAKVVELNDALAFALGLA